MTDKEVFARAADDLIRLSNMFRGLLQVGEYMKSIASLEQAAAEAERRIEDATKKHDKVLAGISVSRNDHAQNIEQMHKAAEVELDSKLAGKKSELSSITASHDLVAAQLEQRRGDLGSVNKQIADAKDKLDGLGAQIEEKARELKGVRDQHKALVASIANIK